MKRSRRVVMKLMGTVALGTITMGFRRGSDCVAQTSPDGTLTRRIAGNCSASFGGFGAAHQRFQFRGGGG